MRHILGLVDLKVALVEHESHITMQYNYIWWRPLDIDLGILVIYHLKINKQQHYELKRGKNSNLVGQNTVFLKS